jgi:hypothetical protein
MRPRPQLDSDLGTTKSSSGNNKQKENKNKHGSRFGITGSIFTIAFSPPAALLPRPRPAKRKI